MRLYLKEKYDNNEKDICILGYRSGGKASKNRKTLIDIINYDTNEYICDHSCQQYSYQKAYANSFIIADAAIYEYTKGYCCYGDIDYGLRVKNIRSQVTAYVYKDNLVFVPSESIFNAWYFRRLYIHLNVDNYYHKYNFDLMNLYEDVPYGHHSFHIQKDYLKVLYAGYGISDNEGYQVEEETDEYYILYYSKRNSRIKAYKTLKGWINEYKSIMQNQSMPLSADAQV